MNTKIKYMLLVAMSMLTAVSSSANEAEVRNFVSGVADDIVSIVRHRSADRNRKADKLLSVIKSNFDTEWMGQFALGRNYRTLSSSKKSKYFTLYKRYLRNTYFPILMKYQDETYSVNRVTLTGTDLYNVSVAILRPGRSSIDLDYTVRKKGRRYKMLDMSIEGVSTVFTQKSEFGAVLARSGIEGLFNSLSKVQINGT